MNLRMFVWNRWKGGVSLAGACLLFGGAAAAEEEPQGQWEIALAGNAYLTAEGIGGGRGGRGGDRIERNAPLRRWSHDDSVVSIFFRVDQPGEIDLALRLRVPEGESRISASAGEQTVELDLSGAEVQELPLFRLEIAEPGHQRLDLRGLSRGGPVFAEVSDLLVSSATEGLELTYVRSPGSNRFYWGRRGPSVHASYEMPRDREIEYAYSELTVPEGEDPIGSYFMANGFGEGYFGIQVNGTEERRVLFSVWSPFQTDNPQEIPEDQRIVVLRKGEGVYTGEFGNEGSGGQSYWVFPWKAGNTYRFLNSARPDGEGSTVYTAWFFAPELDEWRLIASFKRPQTDTWYTRFHGFLENFADARGYEGRIAWHGNQWVRDNEGEWHELTRMRFTGDDIARRGYRVDFAGGVEGERFFLRNGGFFDETVALDSRFERESTADRKPDIDFEALP